MPQDDPEGKPVYTGPQTSALNLHNPAQSNLYKSDDARAAVGALERTLLGENRWMTRREAAHSGDISLLSARKIWRALGMPNLKDEDIYFTGADSEALGNVSAMVRSGHVTEDAVLSIVRSVGQMMDRMVAWQVEAIVEDMVAHQGMTDAEARRELLNVLPELLNELEDLIRYGYRRQLNAAVIRLALKAEKPVHDDEDALDYKSLPLVRGIGFADLVSFTSLSRQMSEKTLASLVQHFEQKCAEVVAVGGGRIIKTVGDEILFMTESPEAAARISLTLSHIIREDPNLPEARVAFVWGRILPRLGDVYGPTVNLASRLVALAEPGSVLTDSSTARVLDGDERFVLQPLGPRNVRGFGEVQPAALAPGVGTELEIDFE
ncbi:MULTISPECIES: adenylate/guanylate cyclase domain-containing protein [Micrococcales]|uniref:adenylate/guanylate cyclase domain-containing protein n=1 Tax=Micrococcales TaxID=85006 RepID=UPI0004AB8801|nr:MULTISPECIES: adenylate/guanylate cyclase domain-containing protein [Micrococcales]